MIPHREFAKLRLSDFIAPGEIVRLDNWEFGDRLWVGEAVGFTEWLRLQSSPRSLSYIALDLDALPAMVTEACLERIGLPLRPGMTLAELRAHLGEPSGHYDFTPGRTTYEFHLGPDSYDISCTVLADGGLVYLTVMVPEAASSHAFESKPLGGPT